MRNRELSRQLAKLQTLFKKTGVYKSDIEVMSHWARYLCVQCAGFVENSIEELYGEYAKARASENVSNYVISRLRRIHTPKTQTLLEVASSFSATWHAALEAFVLENGRKDAIDSLVNDRHHVAHGGDSAITIVRVQQYLDKAIEVIEFLENQLSNDQECGASDNIAIQLENREASI